MSGNLIYNKGFEYNWTSTKIYWKHHCYWVFSSHSQRDSFTSNLEDSADKSYATYLIKLCKICYNLCSFLTTNFMHFDNEQLVLCTFISQSAEYISTTYVCIHVVYLKVSPSQIFQNGVHIPTTSNICIALLWEKCLDL